MSELSAHIKQAFEDFDASYHKLRAHLLHTLGVDEHQLAHDTATAAKPVVAEAEQDAENLAAQAATEFDAAAATKMAVAPKTTTAAATTSWSTTPAAPSAPSAPAAPATDDGTHPAA